MRAVMLADEFPEMGYRSPKSLGGSPVSLLLYVTDVDTFFAQATAAGATETMAVADTFDGDRRGTLTDPFGHVLVARNEAGRDHIGRVAKPIFKDDGPGRAAPELPSAGSMSRFEEGFTT